MRKLLFILLPLSAAITSCDDYGQKVEIGKNEVFYKGEGVTQEQAEKTGAFLKEASWFDDSAAGSAQITKDTNAFVIHLVAEKAKLNDGIRWNLWKLQEQLSATVFNNQDARFAFADEKLNDFETLSSVDAVRAGQGTVYYESKAFKKEEAQKLADFLEGAGYLNQEKQVDVLLRKESSTPVVRLIVDKEALAQNENVVLLTFGYWQSLIQDAVLTKDTKLVLTGTDYQDIKPVPAITEADKQSLEAEMAKLEQSGSE